MREEQFEQRIPFKGIPAAGGTDWLPVIKARVEGRKLPLLFDTGASTTMLHRDLYPVLGVNHWTDGQAIQTQAVGGNQPAHRFTDVEIEFLGKQIRCPVHLGVLPTSAHFVGLFGRETLFEEFGFGFWESDHSLLVTLNP